MKDKKGAKIECEKRRLVPSLKSKEQPDSAIGVLILIFRYGFKSGVLSILKLIFWRKLKPLNDPGGIRPNLNTNTNGILRR